MDTKKAREIVERFHYSHSWPGSAQFAYGVRSGRELVGCVVFGCGANRNASGFLHVRDGEFLELLRLWLKDRCPKNSESRVIATAIRLIRRDLPQIRVLMSYADPEHNHLGTVYQASNWIYIGKSKPISKVLVKGEQIHMRTIHDKFGTKNVEQLKKVLGHDDVRTVYLEGKHCYVYVLDPELDPFFSGRRKPYPKGE